MHTHTHTRIHLYTLEHQCPKQVARTIAKLSQILKILNITYDIKNMNFKDKFTKHVQDLNTENYKTLLRN